MKEGQDEMGEGRREEREDAYIPPPKPKDRYDIVVGEIAFWRDESFGTELLGLGIYFWVV